MDVSSKAGLSIISKIEEVSQEIQDETQSINVFNKMLESEIASHKIEACILLEILDDINLSKH